MGMYTEIYVNADLKKNTPAKVINILMAICNRDHSKCSSMDLPDRWSMLFSNGSYYTPSTEVGMLTFDDISKSWSIIGKGDIKNYEEEIEQFFEFITPWCEDGFIGYSRYEEDIEPKLYYS